MPATFINSSLVTVVSIRSSGKDTSHSRTPAHQIAPGPGAQLDLQIVVNRIKAFNINELFIFVRRPAHL